MSVVQSALMYGFLKKLKSSLFFAVYRESCSAHLAYFEASNVLLFNKLSIHNRIAFKTSISALRHHAGIFHMGPGH